MTKEERYRLSLRVGEGPGKRVKLEDGVYLVDQGKIWAGIVIKDGKVTQCAPVLRKRLGHWLKVARRVA